MKPSFLSTVANPKAQAFPQLSNPVELVKWMILGIAVAASGLMMTIPEAQPVEVVYLPPLTGEMHDNYTKQVRQYNEMLTRSNHSINTHFDLADALSNLGERETAMNAYLSGMSHHSTPHTH